MTKIMQIEDKGATIAWSPVAGHPDVIALGTKDSGGSGFDDTGGELDLYDLNLTSPDGNTPTPKLLGSVKTTSRFASVAWSPGGPSLADRFSMGLLAGGMTDGTVHVWNPKALIMQQPDSVLATLPKCVAGHIKALQFSPLNQAQMAFGGANGQVIIADLSQPQNPTVVAPCDDNKQSAEITSVAWNTQVGHIVASAAGDGSVSVWDLNSRKAWCELRCETTGQAVADISWNPSQGLHLMTASLDDRNPVLKLWDLRASTSMPLATLQGHSKGILKTAWCAHDDTLLLSCGKDNRTILWDLYTLRPIADIPNDVPAVGPEENNNNSAMFGASGLAPAQQRRYDIQWSPIKRGVLASCSLDRKVQVHSVIGLATQSGRPPKWMKPSSSVSCGYGGAVVSCGAPDKFVRVRTIVEQPELVQASNAFEAELSAVNVVDFCHSRAAKAKTQQEHQTWGFMKIMFESNARQHLLGHLGFDAEKIAKLAQEYTENGENGVASMSLEDKAGGKMSKPAESAVKEALLVGDFEAAVECCFRTGNLADALILASCGGAELWSKTQERYFAMEAPKRPFLSVVSAVIRNQLGDLVSNSDPSRWKETLAMLSTYGQSDEFPKLCIQLGDRLAAAGDHHSANLCYMCSLSLEHSVQFWQSQLQAANKRKGSVDLLALHEFVVKVTVFLKASGESGKLSDGIADLFTKYAGVLADQGLLVTAAKYCRGNSPASKILRDRLYRSRSSQMCLRALGSPPEFPFSMVTVNKTPANTTVNQRQRQQNQSSQYSQQQSSYGQQQSSFGQQQQQSSYGQQQSSYGQQLQQSSYSKQPSSTATQASAPSKAHPTTTSTPQLPAGWVALQDPSSGNTYYANQTTGETSWEMPQAPSATPGASAAASAAPAASTNNNTLASKYGDGFVTSASHPELASQYGNVGTSNPYTGVERPGIAQVASSKAPVSGTLNFNSVELSAELVPIKDNLLGIVSSLGSSPMTAADKRQLSEAEKGVAILVKRLARDDIPDDVSAKVVNLVNALLNRDYNTTLAIQKDLVNHDWKDHKDWLKGIKFLISLAQKRLG